MRNSHRRYINLLALISALSVFTPMLPIRPVPEIGISAEAIKKKNFKRALARIMYKYRPPKVPTTDHDFEMLARAQEKRARKQQRNINNAFSMGLI